MGCGAEGGAAQRVRPVNAFRIGFQRSLSACLHGLVALAALTPAPAARAATPCTDVPGFDALACRVEDLRETASALGGQFAARLTRATLRVDAGADACDEGRSAAARHYPCP